VSFCFLGGLRAAPAHIAYGKEAIFIATQELHHLLRQFRLEDDDAEMLTQRELTEGHINSTYFLEAKGASGTRRYILQKINTFVFENPAELMENIVRVTNFLRERIAAQKSSSQLTKAMQVYPTRGGKWFFVDEAGGCWRCYNFVENTYSLQAAGNNIAATQAARAFGDFQRLLDGFPIGQLHETIPNFHHTKKRYDALEEAIAANTAGRKAAVGPEIAFARARKNDASRLLELQAAGQLPLRVTHNDTKLNNVLFDCGTDEAVCVVDLDTVMPGLSLYDFGDSLRFLGNTAAEDERDLRKVRFSMPLFRAYTQGYLKTAAAALTPQEVRQLPFSVKLMTYECGMRFLTDYLNGDVYFRIRRPDDNLARCRTQFRLVEEIEAQLPAMEEFVEDFLKKP
jgi:hypothetical protein